MSPRVCSPHALRHFSRQLPRLETTDGLLQAAVAISMHAFERTDVAEVERTVRSLAVRVRAGVRAGNERALLAHLHRVLFDEEAFEGTAGACYRPLSSYLPLVLLTKRGTPVSLSLLYKVVGEYAGLKIEGVDAPGYFLARVRLHNDTLLIDPFNGGRVLSEDEAFERIGICMQRSMPRNPEFLASCSHQRWIARLLGTLEQACARSSFHLDRSAFQELSTVLNERVTG